MYTTVLYIGIILGLICAAGFLVLHRPRHFYRLTEVNASYWVIAVALLYARSLVLLILRGSRPPDNLIDAVISLGLLAAIDALLAIRFVTYLKYVRRAGGNTTTGENQHV